MYVRSQALIFAAFTLALAQPASARQDERPITDGDPSAVDVAKTPVTDLNIAKDEIPQILIDATAKPYDLTGLGTCAAIADAVTQLDTVLGPDLDLPQSERDRISAGRVAKWVVASFIPFRGLIREISGANDHQRKVRAAIQAGMTRRGFLKGIGTTRKCKYPAAPATDADVARIQAELDRIEAQERASKKTKQDDDDERRDGTDSSAQPRTGKGVPIVSEPVVQPTR